MIRRPSEKIVEGLKQALRDVRTPLTVADAATKGGITLADAKDGLNFLIADYRGHLAATAKGELLYSFPTGFKKPWERQERWQKIFNKIKKGLMGSLKFLVRAWISIVMVGYVVIFALIILALSFSKSSDRDDGPSLSGALMFHTLLRLVLDSLFWTFHPFSPFYIGNRGYGYDHYVPARKKTPFYEKVNGFFFGPEEKPVDEQELRRLVLEEIRAQKGRVGLLDLMRVTGMGKDEADPFMARLMVDYDGDVSVSDEGGIIYEFPEVRKSSLNERVRSPDSIWQKRETMPQFTGNSAGSNVLIAGLNGFNLLMSTIAISNSWTIEKLKYVVASAQTNLPPDLLPPPPDGTPLVLGWIPFIFSAALFLIPTTRALGRGRKKREIDVKNGKRGLIRAILSKLGFKGIREDVLKQAWVQQAQAKPDKREFTREIIRLGGELDLNEKDEPVYRFKAIEAEMNALGMARSRADDAEASVGEIIFSSAK